jgi:TolA-binding protein
VDERPEVPLEPHAARDDASKAALVQRIVAYLQKTHASSEVRQTLEILDKLGAITPRDEVIVARAAASAGVNARAVAGFARVAAASPLGAADRMAYASALARAGRAADAARMYATITDDAALAPLAAYQRARVLVPGDGVAARAALHTVAVQYPTARAAAAPALLLLADLQVDDGEFTDAAQTLRELITRFPTASQAPLARFRAGMLQWA